MPDPHGQICWNATTRAPYGGPVATDPGRPIDDLRNDLRSAARTADWQARETETSPVDGWAPH